MAVYTPERDELRVNARTRGEQELYRQAFGVLLHGREDYFRLLGHCLSPLLALGREALECQDVLGLSQVRLTRLDLDLGDEEKLLVVVKAENVFTKAWWLGKEGIPEGAKLMRAGFALFLTGCEKPLEVQVKPPNTVRLCQHNAARIAYEWMEKRRFRKAGGPQSECSAEATSNPEAMRQAA